MGPQTTVKKSEKGMRIGKSVKETLLPTTLAVGLFLIVGIITAVIPNPWFTRMTPITWLEWAFLIGVSILTGAYLFLRKRRRSKGCDTCATAGSVLGFFAVTCPFCNALLVAIFGGGIVAAYFEPARPYVGIIGVITLLGLIIYEIKMEKEGTP